MLIGIDFGGTNIKYALVTEAGDARALKSTPTLAEQGPDRVIQRLTDCVGELQAEAKSIGETIRGIGLGVAGPLDFASGVVSEAPNLPGWRNIPLRDRLSAAVGLPVQVDNDANVAVYGEWWRGAGQNSNNMVGMTLGTGVGGGIIINRQLYRGSLGMAGEIGHVSLDPNGPQCGCGGKGCLEAYASATAMVRRTRSLMESGKSTLLTEYVAGDLNRLTAKLIHDACKQQDRLAVQVMGEMAFYLGIGVVNLIHLFNPDVITLSGGMAQAGEDLFAPLRRVVEERAFQRPYQHTRIVQATLVDRAGVIGAARLALD